ncbi:MmgE/PrpD family protein [Phreatobacter stygius]|uniref:MmgE/PrpD family protein n=1 Tax=Phreatobacter stygius TaxID=1940610 RepID=A0A4D7B3W1_9HYPH|nr:MmgE/PrpD family protein [Phreatobacter stygius]QCI64730.1 MmgE/PrpD family protein [Phreatobacter stygius]
MTDPIEGLIDHAAGVRASAVPARTIAFQARRVLDNLGCLAAGHDQAGTGTALSLARRWSGTAEATVIGSTERLAAPQTAFVNAVRARALDFCDVLSPGWHPSSSDVPVALAAAELSDASGADILAALAVGQDVGQRINRAAQANGFFYRGFDSNILGLFSGAVIAGRLLGLSRDQLGHAVGLAFDFGIGTFQHYQDKALAVRISQGLVARHALEATLMAAAGITGPRRVLAGESGFFRLYGPAEPRLDGLDEGLGQRFLGQEATCFKLYPSCGVTLALTEALLAARQSGDLRPAAVTDVAIRISPTMRVICGGAYAPTTTPEIDAQFSVRYVAANAILRGRATLEEFTASAATAPDIVAFAGRMAVAEEPAFGHFDQCEVIVRHADGSELLVPAQFGRGWPENPASTADLAAKFRQCVAFSGRECWIGRADHLIAAIETLAEAPNVGPMIEAFAA